MKRVTKAAAQAAADEVEKALDQIVREAKDEIDERKEMVKASEEYGWWKSLSSERRFLAGGAIAVVVFIAAMAGLKAILS